MSKVILYTCKSGVELIESGHSLLAWEKGSDTYNHLNSVDKKNYPFSVSEEFIYRRGTNEDFSIMRNSDAKILSTVDLYEFIDDSEIYISNDAESPEIGCDVSLKITPNYTNGSGVDSWESAKNSFRKNNSCPTFFIEVSKNLEPNDSYDNFTSISIEEAEKLIEFLQNKINYIKGD